MTQAAEKERLDLLEALSAKLQQGEYIEVIAQLQGLICVSEEEEGRRNFLLGLAHHLKGDAADAERIYRKLLAENSNQPGIMLNLALLLARTAERPEQAIDVLNDAVALHPEWVEARLLLCDCLCAVDRQEDARKQLREALQLGAEDVQLWLRYADFLTGEQAYLEVALLEGKLGQNGVHLVASAIDLLGLGEAADVLFSRVVNAISEQGDPQSLAMVDRYQAYGLLVRQRYEEALAHYERAVRILPKHESPHFGYGWTLLSLRRYKEAWPHFWHRSRLFWLRDREIPEWRGEPLAGKVLYVHSEQGAGDVINSLRFLPVLREMGAKIVFDTYLDVLALLAQTEGARQTDDDLTEATPDYQVRLMDVPVMLNWGLSDIPNLPYLSPAPNLIAHWEGVLEEVSPRRPDKLRVGLVWAGNPLQRNDVNRSMALSDFAPLACMPGIEWVSLQKGAGAIELTSVPDGMPLTALGERLDTFGDTAAAISHLDLVITVCTSVAHVAGAMGKPVWILVTARHPDYRWHEDGDSSEWYPSARLFRLQQPGQWRSLVREQLRPALASLLQSQLWSNLSLQRQHELSWLAGTGMDVHQATDWVSHLSSERDWLNAVDFAIEYEESFGQDLLWRVLCQAEGAARKAIQNGRIRRLVARSEWDHLVALANELSQKGELNRQGCRLWFDALISADRPDEATAVLEVLGRYGLDGEWQYRRGRLAVRQGDNTQAEEAFTEAVRLLPRHALAHNDLAVLLAAAGAEERALALYQRAVMLNPLVPLPWKNIALLAAARGAHCLAEAAALKYHELQQDGFSADVVGIALTKSGRLEEAAKYHKQAVELEPSHMQIQANAGWALGKLQRFDESLRHLRTATRLPGTSQGAWMGLAWELLARGEMGEGWDAYERGMSAKDTVMREWRGEPLNGKRLLVYQDQGYGDLFQFVHLIRELEGEVTLAVYHLAHKLLNEQDYPCKVIRIEEVDWSKNQYDYYVAQMKLPRWLHADLVEPVIRPPYLCAPQDRVAYWADRLASFKQPKIGFVWSGSSRFSGNATRSTNLSDWKAVGQVEEVCLFSLQKDEASNQALQVEGFHLENIAPELDSFAETAAVMMNMNLIISTCTAVAHLAGALGRPVWVLIPSDGPDWRWLRDRDDCPWYPSTRLFRKQATESWSDLMERVSFELRKWVREVS